MNSSKIDSSIKRARIGGAALAVETVDLEDGGVESAVEIGVGENNGGRFAAQLERQALQLIGRGFHDDGAGGGFASQRDERDQRMSHQRRARFFAEALDNVEDAGRQVGLFEDLRELPRRERRPLGRFQDDRVAGGERRSDAPGGKHHGRVPGRDDAARAHRHSQAVVEPLVIHRIRAAVHGLLGVFGVKAEVFGGAGDLRANDLERLPGIQAFDGGQLVAVLFDQAGDLEQVLLAVLGFAVAPFLKRRVSRFGRAIDIFGVAAPGASEHAVGGRIERFESFAARAFASTGR